MGLSSLRAQHAGFLRGLYLIEASTTQRLGRLHAALADRTPRRIDAAPPRLHAGVLVPLFRTGEGVELLFTRRTDTVLTHKGQISFPGGQRETSDASPVETALRESYEEIGLDPSRIQVFGELDDMFTSVSGFVVTPVVGLVSGTPRDLTLAPAEVKSIFTVSTDRLADEGVYSSEIREVDGRPFRIHYFRVGDDVIWGATGYIVHQFLAAWEQAATAA